jgi:cyclopropane-fatty-acyl-phospholipid synthase
VGLTAESVFKQALVQFRVEPIRELFAAYPNHDFQVRLWDGSTWGEEECPHFTIVLKHPRALREIFLSPSELTLGESYVFDDLDIEGDIEAACEMGSYLLSHRGDHLPLSLRLASLWRQFPDREAARGGGREANLSGAVHSKDRDRQAIGYHYDLPPDFFALWLDQRRVYSCAYFVNPGEDLDTAQCRKLDYICRKLRLRRGDKLLDIGCGWGGLLSFAAGHYGVEAFGITLSVRQAEVARERIRESGLHDRCRVEVCDYRDVPVDCQFDKVVSVGMFEHVGEKHLPEYFSRAWQLLRPGGAFLNAGIAASPTYQRQGPSFIDKYVFPDGELVPISTCLGAAEKCGFEIRDVENLREHYAMTLHHWVQRLQSQARQAKHITDETTYRIWRLYMAASACAFRAARLNLYQVLLAKPKNGDAGMPLTRDDWYQ